MIKASDVMRTDTTSVLPSTTVEELGRLFIEKKVTGLPVVDENGKLLGVVTENDLISQNKRIHIPTMLRLFDAFIPLEGFKSIEKEIKKMAATVVSDIYTQEVISVTEETSLEEIATLMTERRVHHLPVVRGDMLVGMLDQHDVIKGLAGESPDKES